MIPGAIVNAYAGAEITLVLADLKAQNRCILVYGVVELCAAGQPPSVAITSGGFSQFRKYIGGDITLYAKRHRVSTQEGLAFFLKPSGQPSNLRGLPIELAGNHQSFPPGGEPLLIEPNLFGDSSVGAMLPRRPTCLSLLSKYDTTGNTLTLLGKRFKPMVDGIFEATGIDFTRFEEHVGALHLCFANPIVSRIDLLLSGDEKHLLLTLSERPGISLEGCQVELGNEWPFGQGFTIMYPVTSGKSVIPLPAVPASLRFRLFDATGRCIETHPGSSFIKSSIIEMFQIATKEVVHTFRDGETGSFKVTTAEPLNPVQKQRERSPLEHLRAANVRRELEDLKNDKVLMFFIGGPASRAEAIAALRELIGRARQRVTVVDNYLSVDDVALLASMIRHKECDTRFLASHERLSKMTAGSSEESRLALELPNLASKFEFEVHVRKLPGSGPHDRWLQIDDAIYSLGSSVNHLGSRATTLFRLPRPEEVASQIETWWAASKALSSGNSLSGTMPVAPVAPVATDAPQGWHGRLRRWWRSKCRPGNSSNVPSSSCERSIAQSTEEA